MKALQPGAIHPPFGAYSHGTLIPAGWRIVRTAGQLGIRADGSVPENVFDQAAVCFDAIREILREGGLSPSDVAHVSAWVTDRAFVPDYMRARDAFVGPAARLPASTLLIVSGFTRPEFKVEVEVMAAAP